MLNEGLLGIAVAVVGLFGWLLKYVMTENSKREAESAKREVESAKREAGYQVTMAKNLEVIQEQQSVIRKLADRYEDVQSALNELRDEVIHRLSGGTT